MSVTLNLGGTDLNPSMVWTDRYTWQDVTQTTTRTLSGQHVTFVQGTAKGRPITLVANEETGWLTLSQVNALQVLANVAGAVYTLQVDADTFQVQLRHEDPPGFEAAQLVDGLVPTDGTFGDNSITYFTATIKLTEV